LVPCGEEYEQGEEKGYANGLQQLFEELACQVGSNIVQPVCTLSLKQTPLCGETSVQVIS
jgi:hypothetical protein